jgi:hypothetical protein
MAGRIVVSVADLRVVLVATTAAQVSMLLVETALDERGRMAWSLHQCAIASGRGRNLTHLVRRHCRTLARCLKTSGLTNRCTDFGQAGERRRNLVGLRGFDCAFNEIAQ